MSLALFGLTIHHGCARDLLKFFHAQLCGARRMRWQTREFLRGQRLPVFRVFPSARYVDRHIPLFLLLSLNNQEPKGENLRSLSRFRSSVWSEPERIYASVVSVLSTAESSSLSAINRTEVTWR